MKKVLTFFLLVIASVSTTFGAMPSKVYAPYVDVMLWPTFDLMAAYNATGQKYFTLAFVIAGTDGQPAWGGALNMASNHMLDQVNSLRAAGGDVIISFGGANGTPISSTITDVNALANAYQQVIDKYGVTWIDFDVEGWWVQDQASIDRRNQAAAILQSNNPNLRITYCLPVMPTGLTADGINVINKAKAAGVNIYSVNVMTMDYGQSNQAMGQAAISAAQNTHSQTNLNVGVTPMIGKNDTANEIFSLANGQEVLSFVTNTSWVNMLAMWSVNRDNGGCPGQTAASATCSGLSQSTYDFVNLFKPYSGTDGGGNDGGGNDDGGDNDGGGNDGDDSGVITVEAETYGDMSGVEIEACNEGGQNVGYIDDGDWMAYYDINFSKAGDYTVQYRVASETGGGTLSLDLNAGSITLGSVTVPATGGWQTWQTITNTIHIDAAGTYNLGVFATVGGWNLNWIKIQSTDTPDDGGNDDDGGGNDDDGGNDDSNHLVKSLEAENFGDMSGVEIEACTEGGQNVSYIDTGDWMAYFDINFPSSGTYKIEYRVASETGGGTLSLDLNAGNITLGSISVPATGGWQTWQTISQTVTIDAAGTYNLGIFATVGGWNLNWVKIYGNGTSDDDGGNDDDNDDGDNDDGGNDGNTGTIRSGEMTYYGPASGYPTDLPANAGGYTADDLTNAAVDYFCAMQISVLLNEQLMGACIEVTSPSGKKEKFLVADILPTGQPGDVDIYGKDVFRRIENPDLGRVNATWQIVPLPTTGNVQYRFQAGSNEWWAALQIFNHKYPIKKVEYKNASGQFVTMTRQSDGGNFFIASGMGSGPYTIRLTDYFDHVLVHEGIQMQSSIRQEASSNFRVANTAKSLETDETSKVSSELYSFPNPTNSSTQFRFTVKEGAQAKLTIYNAAGKAITTLVNDNLKAGNHIAEWNVEQVENGIYYARLLVNDHFETFKVIVNK